MNQSRYLEINTSSNPHDKMYNGHILHYTRRNPETGEIEPIPKWVKSICPWDSSLSRNEWQVIERPVFTTEQLWAEVLKIPQVINNSDVSNSTSNGRVTV
jgi:hypothetical protein